MKKMFVMSLIMIMTMFMTPAFAGTHGKDGKISPRSVGACACSLLVWPGSGQAINEQSVEKDVTHAILGLTGIFRFWSAYDALIDRQGGVWHHRI